MDQADWRLPKTEADARLLASVRA